IRAAEALAKLGGDGAPATDELAKAFSQNDPDLRLAAAQALAEIGPKAEAAMPALLRGLAETDGPLQTATLAALRTMGSPSSADLRALEAAEKNKTSAVRLYAVVSMGKLGPAARSDAFPAIVAILQPEPDVEVAQAAVRSLNRYSPISAPDVAEI